MASGDDVPRIEVVGAGDGFPRRRRRAGSPPPRDRTAWIVAVALVLLVIGGALSRFGDEPADDRDATAPTTTSATSAPSTTAASDENGAGEYVADEPAPVLGEPVAATILLGSEEGWRHLDPDTGWIQPVAELEGLDIAAVVPVPGGVLVLERSSETPSLLSLPVPAPGDEDVVQVVDLELEQVTGVVPNGPRGDHLWILTRSARPEAPDELLATLTGYLGNRVQPPLAIAAPPTAANDVGVVIDAGGRSYLTWAFGTVDLGAGQAYAAAGAHVGRIACDPGLACWQEIVDLTGRVVAGAPFPNRAAALGAVTMSMAPDGSLATLPSRIPALDQPATEDAASATLHVLRPDGRSTQVAVDDPLSAPAWLPGDDGIVVLTGRGLLHLRDVGGELLAGRIPRLTTSDATTVIVVAEV